VLYRHGGSGWSEIVQLGKYLSIIFKQSSQNLLKIIIGSDHYTVSPGWFSLATNQKHANSLFNIFISSQANFLGCDGDVCVPLIYCFCAAAFLTALWCSVEPGKRSLSRVTHCQASTSATTSTRGSLRRPVT